MTDLLHTLPDFPQSSYSHLIPSLEKSLISTTDLITLDALEIAKRAHLPTIDVRRLCNHVATELQRQLGVHAEGDEASHPIETLRSARGNGLHSSGREIASRWSTISLLDDDLDTALNGGIPTGYITELTGESGVGKTQLLLTLLLSAQLPLPHGLSRPTLYISTEHPLPTTRLTQILSINPFLSSLPAGIPKPSLSHIFTYQLQDLESQDHILNYQLPVLLSRENIGLVVIDSIAANYRAEASYSTSNPLSPSSRRQQVSTPLTLAHRSTNLVRLGQHLRLLAQRFDTAIVVANQVADRFPALPSNTITPAARQLPQVDVLSSSPAPACSSPAPTPTPTLAPIPPSHQPPNLTVFPLTLDHQQRFFTGWGSSPSPLHNTNLKTPSLGLAWSNQIACRIAITKERAFVGPSRREPERQSQAAEWSERGWRRWVGLVFAPWARGMGDGERGVEIEVWGGGVRAVRVEGERS